MPTTEFFGQLMRDMPFENPEAAGEALGSQGPSCSARVVVTKKLNISGPCSPCCRVFMKSMRKLAAETLDPRRGP